METEQEKYYRQQNEKTAREHQQAKDNWKATKWFLWSFPIGFVVLFLFFALAAAIGSR